MTTETINNETTETTKETSNAVKGAVAAVAMVAIAGVAFAAFKKFGGEKKDPNTLEATTVEETADTVEGEFVAGEEPKTEEDAA